VASSEIARKINRSNVLDMIRTNQPLSRADLARRTGLQRSTVSLIVDQLISERWVAEGDLGQLPRGRRPRLLYLNTDRAGIIGINIMPRLTSIVLADLNGRFRAEESIPTSRDPSTFIGVLSSYVCRLIRQHADVAYEGIGVSVPGRVDYLAQRLVFAPNLGWQEVDLKNPLESSTGLPVQIENAANACALAEVWSGPHEGRAISSPSPYRKESVRGSSPTATWCGDRAARRANSAMYAWTRRGRNVSAAAAGAGRSTPRTPQPFGITAARTRTGPASRRKRLPKTP